MALLFVLLVLRTRHQMCTEHVRKERLTTKKRVYDYFLWVVWCVGVRSVEVVGVWLVPSVCVVRRGVSWCVCVCVCVSVCVCSMSVVCVCVC